MPVDPQAAAILAQLPPGGLFPDTSLTPQQLRERASAPLQKAFAAHQPTPVREVRDTTFAGPAGDVPVRVYVPTPEGAPPQAGVVYFHGGGFFSGSLDTHDGICRALAAHTPCILVSVDYRLAPEHPFPAGVEDAFAAVQWVAQNAHALGIDPRRIAVAGDSAGGNLSTVAVLSAKRAGGPPLAFQLLLYPAVGGDPASHPSLTEYAEGYFLTKGDMDFFWRCYAGEHPPMDDRLTPICAPDLAGLPPALVITAEFDPLRDEGADYARRLAAAGVPTEYKCYEGQLHGFISMAGVVDRAAVALKECIAALAKALHVSSARPADLAAEA